MQKSKTVKIQLNTGEEGKVVEKGFTVKEMSIRSIIELSQNNSFFTDSKANTPDVKKDENGLDPGTEEKEAPGGSLFDELSGMGDDIGKIIEQTCDFKLVELLDLYPSEVKELYEAFQEVNQTFLDVLRKLKILDMFLQVLERAFNNFSGMLAI